MRKRISPTLGFALERYITRNGPGWQFALPTRAGGPRSIYFADSAYGHAPARSRLAAIRFRDEHFQRLGLKVYARVSQTRRQARNMATSTIRLQIEDRIVSGRSYTSISWHASWMEGSRQRHISRSVRRHGWEGAYGLVQAALDVGVERAARRLRLEYSQGA